MTTATIETNIWQALKARAATLPSPVDYTICWPDQQDFTKPADGDGVPAPYIEVSHLPNVVTRLAIDSDGQNDRPGILVMALMYPVARKATHDVMRQQAGLIAAHFPADLLMTYGGVTVRVERAPDVPSPVRDDTYLRWPVGIRWRCVA